MKRCPEDVWGQVSPAGWMRLRRRARMIIEEAGLHPGTRVVELGCGTGSYTALFAATGAGLLAVDISAELLKRLAEHLPDVQTLCAPAELLEEIPACSADAVVGNAILHHLDVPLALRTMLRILKPRGRICFAEPNMANPQIALQKNIPPLKRLLGDSPHETAFLRWRIASQLQRAGFADVRVLPFDFLHPWVPSTLAKPVASAGWLLEKVPLFREIAGSLLISARKP